ncbi:hypothetical protein VE04_08950 [Pseudogymnoascus sp. 24MN13]|nr:hypothetical protein VE04_08950 [Pseudogymnoascus sp. 24MN13]
MALQGGPAPRDNNPAPTAETNATTTPKKSAVATPKKDKVTKPRKPRKRNAPSGQGVTDGDKAKLPGQIKDAIAHNFPGVLLVKTQSLAQTPLQAGYMHMKDTQELRNWLDEVYELPVVQQWSASRMVGFGMNNTTKDNIHKFPDMMNLMQRDDGMTEEECEKGLPVSMERYPPTAKGPRAAATWNVTMWTIIKKYPQYFPVDEDKPGAVYILGIDVENWHRAFFAIKQVWREDLDTRKALKGDVKNPQVKTAVTPYFLSIEDFQASGADRIFEVTSVEAELVSYFDSEATSATAEARAAARAAAAADDGEDDAPDYVAAKAELKSFEETFQKQSGQLASLYPDECMPALGEKAVIGLLEQLTKPVKVLYGSSGMAAASISPVEVGRVVQDATTEQEALEGRQLDMKSAAMEKFWGLQNQLNQASAKTRSYDECCDLLGLDPATRTAGGVSLIPWQVTGSEWILRQWEHGLGTGLFADDVGLGKTVSSLAALQIGVDLARARRDGSNTATDKPCLGLEGPYKPTLVVCPASALSVWKEEIARFPSMSLRLWVGSPAKAMPDDRLITLHKSPDALKEYTRQFRDDDPATALQIVLTTYQTFHIRTIFFESTKGKGRADDGLGGPEEDDFGDEADEAVLSREELRTISTKAAGLFGTVLADEAHKLKSVFTRTHQSIARLGASRMLLITATPTINKSIDLYGILSLIWDGLRDGLKDRLDFSLDDPVDVELDDYRAATLAMRQCESTQFDLEELAARVKFLNPTTFKRIVSSEQQLTTGTAAAILPIILSTIQLRRVRGGEIVVDGKTEIIGGSIPLYKIITVELEMSQIQAERYAAIHLEALAGSQPTGPDEEPQPGTRVGTSVHRRLCFAAFHTGLDNFFRSSRVTTAKVADWNARKDYGYTVYHKLTRMDVLSPAHRSRISAAISICAPSPKLQWLCGLVRDVCLLKKRNIIVFCSWPATQWLVELLMFIVGVPVMSIRAAHTSAARAETQFAFNNKCTEGTVLVTNLRLGATSMNLQKQCCDLVFLEVPESGNTAAQGIGRVHRIGQTKEQHIYIVTCNHSWDQRQQARTAQKMYGQIAGQTNIQVSRDEVLKLAATLGDEGEGEDAEPLTPEARVNLAEARLRHAEVIRLYMEMFGQRSRRDEWTEERDMTEKDFLPSEAEKPLENAACPSVTRVFRRLAKQLVGDNDTTAPQPHVPMAVRPAKKRLAQSAKESTSKRQKTGGKELSEEYVHDSEDEDDTMVETESGTLGPFSAPTPNSHMPDLGGGSDTGATSRDESDPTGYEDSFMDEMDEMDNSDLDAILEGGTGTVVSTIVEDSELSELSSSTEGVEKVEGQVQDKVQERTRPKRATRTTTGAISPKTYN